MNEPTVKPTPAPKNDVRMVRRRAAEGRVAGDVFGEPRRDSSRGIQPASGAVLGVTVGIGVVDGRDGSPEAIGVLHVPGDDRGVGHRQVELGEQAGVVRDAEPLRLAETISAI